MEVAVFAVQRLTALILAPLVLVHLVVILIAVEGGLSAAEILARTRGSIGWGAFYSLFVVAAALHAPVGLRTVIREHSVWRDRSLDIVMAFVMVLLLALGFRAVSAVVLVP